MPRSWVLRRCLFLLVFVLFSIPSSFAQRDLGTITGVVTDASGAVVPRAKLTFTQQTTSERFSAQTGDTGTYARPLLHPGLYTVEAEAAGFRKAVVDEPGIVHGAGDRAEIVEGSSVADQRRRQNARGLEQAGIGEIGGCGQCPGVCYGSAGRVGEIRRIPGSAV